MSKVNKIFVVFLLIAGVLCLAIGTAFAVDFMAEHSEEFACDLKRPVVAANRPFVDPVVEPPLNQWEFPPFSYSLDGNEFLGEYVFDLSLPASSFAKDGAFAVGVSTYDFTLNQNFLFSFNSLELDIYLIDDLSVPLQSFSLSGWETLSLEVGQDSDGILFLRLFGVNASFSRQDLFLGELGDVYLFDFKPSTSLRQVRYNYVSTGSTDSQGLVLYTSISTIIESSIDVINHFYNFSVFYPYNPPVSGPVLVRDIVGILMSGLTATGEAMGEAFSVLAESIFINADGTALSTFGVLVVVFASVSLGLSLTRFVLNFCTSWGKRNR